MRVNYCNSETYTNYISEDSSNPTYDTESTNSSFNMSNESNNYTTTSQCDDTLTESYTRLSIESDISICKIRILHNIVNTVDISVYFTKQCDVDNKYLLAGNLSYTECTKYLEVPAGPCEIEITTSLGSPVVKSMGCLKSNYTYTCIIAGLPGSLKTEV